MFKEYNLPMWAKVLITATVPVWLLPAVVLVMIGMFYKAAWENLFEEDTSGGW